MRVRSILLLVALGMTTGPAFTAEAKYTCADGTELTAIFSPPATTPGSARLVFAGSAGEVTLPQGLSADGGRYADASIEFWIKGNEATLTRGGKATTCRTG